MQAPILFLYLDKNIEVAVTIMNLSALSIRILIKCAKSALQKKFISQYYARYNANERHAALEELINHGLIQSNILPKADTNRSPTFYIVSENGMKWLEKYYRNYPRGK